MAASSSSQSTRPVISNCLSHLDEDAKRRYQEKLGELGIHDPYTFPSGMMCDLVPTTSDLLVHPSDFPDFEYPDIYNYVIFNPSPYTGGNMKAYKSLDAYKYFVAGWVTDVQKWKVPGKNAFIIKSKVKHSQTLSVPALLPWVAIQKDGQVLSAHCDCKAGLGEVCSHITATLFAVEAAVRHLKGRACTDGPRQWGKPTAITGGKSIFAKGGQIDFRRPERKRKHEIDGTDKTQTAPSTSAIAPSPSVCTKFYNELKESGVRSAILSIIPGYNDNYVPQSVLLNMPPPLNELYEPRFLQMPYPELINQCLSTFEKMSLDKEQATYIESETRLQAKSKLWFKMRAGRVTASRFKAAARTDPANPAQSLIKQICYPWAYKFSTAATEWGCEHETSAKSLYEKHNASHHANFKIEDAGLFIHPQYPYLGATPDGLIQCNCCGEGLVEVKCPYCKRDATIEDAANDRSFCLEKEGETLTLKRDHAYYYQVQAQLHLCDRDYCDLVIWTNPDLFVQRILKDSTFFVSVVERVSDFYKLGVLPELLGKWYTRETSRSTPSTSEQQVCYCKEPEHGSMIHCKSDFCAVKVFHQKCLGLKALPKKNWFCPDCRKFKSIGKKKV